MVAHPSSTGQVETALTAVVRKALPGVHGIVGLARLSGGGTQENWAFDGVGADGPLPLILRRAPTNLQCAAWTISVPMATEAELIRRAAAAGVPSPLVRYVLRPSDGLGAGYLMERVAGETFPRRILRDAEYAGARAAMTAQCGRILAAIQRADTRGIADLPLLPAAALVAKFRGIYRDFHEPHPVFDAAIRWLEDHEPPPALPVLVHGDYRNGNFVVGPDGIRAVIDWEFSHVGDPMEDLGWLCINVWRFDSPLPAGGFGEREAVYAAYEEAGGAPVDRNHVRFWEVFACLKYGLICKLFVARHESGSDGAIELAYVGRRTCESEIDILNLLT